MTQRDTEPSAPPNLSEGGATTGRGSFESVARSTVFWTAFGFFALTIVVLLLSTLFNRGPASTNPSNTAVFWALFIILSGPIAFFFTSAASVQLTTKSMAVVLTGGYAVAVIAFYLANTFFVQRPEVWRYYELDNL